MTEQPAVFCDPVEQTWWSQKCAGCGHPLLSHKQETVWLGPDGAEIDFPPGEAIEIPEGSTEVRRSTCTTCNLKAAIGTLVDGITAITEALQNANARMDNAGIAQLPAEPTEGENP